MRKDLLRNVRLLVLSALLALLCAGCLFRPADDLYQLPSLPEGYASLQTAIQEAMDELGAEYATINYGSNTSTVQLMDLDGDGAQETALAFLRLTTAQEQPLRVCLFRQGRDGTFLRTHEISGDGASFHSVVYEDLNGDGLRELIISWQMSARVYILTAYAITDTGAMELMNTTYNASYLVGDLDGDAGNGSEVLVLQQNSTGEVVGNWAEYYRYQDGVMAMTYTAPLSDNIVGGISARAGSLADAVPCIYVSGEAEGGALTDILVLDQNGLRNITRDDASGISSATFRSYADVAATDINDDGVLEIPLPVQVPPLTEEQESVYYVIYWRQFDSSGNAAVSCSTYHAVSDGWYLMLPDSWPGSITIGRDDSRSSRGERAVVFYYWPDVEGETDPEVFLTVYVLTGNNREAWANRSGRFVLYSDSSTIYAASLNEEVWDCGVTREELAQRFRLITVAWSSQ